MAGVLLHSKDIGWVNIIGFYIGKLMVKLSTSYQQL
jgi:hypothetical protein